MRTTLSRCAYCPLRSSAKGVGNRSKPESGEVFFAIMYSLFEAATAVADAREDQMNRLNESVFKDSKNTVKNPQTLSLLIFVCLCRRPQNLMFVSVCTLRSTGQIGLESEVTSTLRDLTFSPIRKLSTEDSPRPADVI